MELQNKQTNLKQRHFDMKCQCSSLEVYDKAVLHKAITTPIHIELHWLNSRGGEQVI